MLWVVFEPIMFSLIGADIDTAILDGTVVGIAVGVILIALLVRPARACSPSSCRRPPPLAGSGRAFEFRVPSNLPAAHSGDVAATPGRRQVQLEGALVRGVGVDAQGRRPGRLGGQNQARPACNHRHYLTWSARCPQAALGPLALDVARRLALEVGPEEAEAADLDVERARTVLLVAVLSILLTAPAGCVVIASLSRRLLTPAAAPVPAPTPDPEAGGAGGVLNLGLDAVIREDRRD